MTPSLTGHGHESHTGPTMQPCSVLWFLGSGNGSPEGQRRGGLVQGIVGTPGPGGYMWGMEGVSATGLKGPVKGDSMA
jgi:hypothetical protein